MPQDLVTPISFSDFPEDVQINILSFLSLAEICVFACTCRRYAALCNLTSPTACLWFAICDRRWGGHIQISRWATPSPRLYKSLDHWEHLIGFWRRVGPGIPGTTPLTFFEWSLGCIIGSHVLPSPFPNSYAVRKIPFLWIGLLPTCDTIIYLHPFNHVTSIANLESLQPDTRVIQVNVSFVAWNHFTVEEEGWDIFQDCHIVDSEEVLGLEASSPPDGVLAEVYQYFANRRSSGWERSARKRRKKKEKLGWFRVTEHYFKLENYCPTPERPLQGFWKGICEDKSLEFYSIIYDDVGGIACLRIGVATKNSCGYGAAFWTSNSTFLEPPFSKSELDIYNTMECSGCAVLDPCKVDIKVVSRILCVNISVRANNRMNSHSESTNFEGRIWEFEDGTFGLGFLGNNFIIHLKPVASHGQLLDLM